MPLKFWSHSSPLKIDFTVWIAARTVSLGVLSCSRPQGAVKLEFLGNGSQRPREEELRRHCHVSELELESGAASLRR